VSGTLLLDVPKFTGKERDSTVANNGNVKQIVNNLDASRTQNFTYDQFNRIKSAHTDGGIFGSDYVIDLWGNMQANQMAGKPGGDYFQPADNNQNRPIRSLTRP
jgi:hypothetical protein